MAAAGTVAVLLPGAFYFLRETRLPPVAALREAGVPIAVATDCNPGTSPLASLLAAMNMACTLFRLTPQEALAGTTRHAARALGIEREAGSLALGKAADFALWNVSRPGELACAIGFNPCRGVVNGGVARSVRHGPG
jgi:imidazolonepropionase